MHLPFVRAADARLMIAIDARSLRASREVGRSAATAGEAGGVEKGGMGGGREGSMHAHENATRTYC